MIRPCTQDELPAMLAIINRAAEAYQGVIPADRWHEPYMSLAELRGEIAARVTFWGYEQDGLLVGIMGIQPVKNVDLIRHAYVAPAQQGSGIGAALIRHLLDRRTSRPTLVGTWAAAVWAIRFYQRHGFHLVSQDQKSMLLKAYWNIPERQIETSVVLEIGLPPSPK